jgi:hypothetical protein
MLLTLADKYDMPVLLSKVGSFLQSNAPVLSSSRSSSQYAWKWIPLADRLGLSEVAKACITGLPERICVDPIVQLVADQRVMTELVGIIIIRASRNVIVDIPAPVKASRCCSELLLAGGGSPAQRSKQAAAAAWAADEARQCLLR